MTKEPRPATLHPMPGGARPAPPQGFQSQGADTPPSSCLSPLSSLALRPPLALDRETPLGEAAARMVEAQISAVLVGEATRPEGIVTERDITRLVAEHRGMAHTRPLWRVMRGGVVSIGVGSTTGEAVLRMAEHGIRHLLVVSGEGAPRGILEERDLLSGDAASPLAVASVIDTATDATALGMAHTTLHHLILRYTNDGIAAVRLGRIVAGLRDRLVTRAAHLALQTMPTPPPSPFTVGVLGSHARREQFFATDQDVALVLSDASGDIPPDAVTAWFARFGETLAEMLVNAGLPPCPHGIMPSSPAWRRPMRSWRAVVDDACRTPEASAVVTLSILADLKGLNDGFDLCPRLTEHLCRRLAETSLPLRLMGREAVRHAPKLGLFNRLPVTRDAKGGEYLDLKRCGLFTLMQGARALALERAGTSAPDTDSHGGDVYNGMASAVDTASRLAALRHTGIPGGELGDDIAHAWEALLGLRLRGQVAHASHATASYRHQAETSCAAGRMVADGKGHDGSDMVVTGMAATGMAAMDMASVSSTGVPSRTSPVQVGTAMLDVGALAPLEREGLRRCLIVVDAFASWLEHRFGLHLIG